MTENNFYKIDHRYNQNNTPIVTTNGQPSVQSYREQIETMLARWHQLQNGKQPCQPIHFDPIMETDLARQLHEIEEQEQYNLLEKTLELQLRQDDHQPCMMSDVVEEDTKKQLKQIELLKQSEKNEQERQYDRILQQLKHYEKFEINSQHRQKTNHANHHGPHHTEEFVYIRQQKHNIFIQLLSMSTNSFQQTKNVRLFYGDYGPIYIEIPISNNATQTAWVSEGVTMKYLRNRIDEISDGYFGDLTTTPATSLHQIENNYYNCPSRNVLIGFAIGIAFIILLLSINLVVMILTKRSKYRTIIEHISGDSLGFDDLFPGLNRTQLRQQQQNQ